MSRLYRILPHEAVDGLGPIYGVSQKSDWYVIGKFWAGSSEMC